MFWIFSFFVLIILGSLGYGALSAAPWVPTRKKDIDRLIRLAGTHPGEVVYELGCGDARVLSCFVKTTGTKGIGIEVSLLQYAFAKMRSWWIGPNLRIYWKNLFSVSLSEADVVYLFLMPEAYAKLRPKFEQELKPGARVITYVWPIPGWESEQVDAQEGRATIFLYKRPSL